ncbi:MAG: hypothetical protein IPQ08_14455 [Chitinophagaceae bacterium]|nr:hypothetical protein [Chitinophagaceae bacterium]
MRIQCLLILFLTGCSLSLCSQTITGKSRLKVFLDCKSYCDADFIRSEINIVDFLNQRQTADVHVLNFATETGGGGLAYELILLGQNNFAGKKDTLRFSIAANSTEFDRRILLAKYLKLGLVPYLTANNDVENLQITMLGKTALKDSTKKTPAVKDPWNYWVFNTGISGYYSSDAVYQSSNINGKFSANKITEQVKFGFEAAAGRDRSVFTFEDSAGNKEKIKVLNSNYNVNQYYILALGKHWSWGYQAILHRNTFSNFKNQLFLESGIEYNVFPYKQFNTKLFTISYILNLRNNRYYDTTLYDRIKETRMGQEVNAKFTYKQKWGSVQVSAKYRSYLHNLDFFNLGANASCELQVSGGFSVFIYTSAELVRDQIYLPKGGATQQEVLTRRRQLESGYNFQTNLGINYRFGSRLNNFVNPRFN